MKAIGRVRRPPRVLVLAVLPLASFVAAAGLSMSTTQDDEPDVAPPPLAVAVSTPQPLPAAILPAAESTSPALAEVRQDCAEVRGSEYRSDEEREWFRQNCLTPVSAMPRLSSSGSVAVQPITGPSAPTAGQYALGDRLIIPKIGVNAPVHGVTVDGSGTMPDPVGYFNALWYDFSAIPGLGGYVDGGNLILAGHVDCARCVNGGPGPSVFFYVRNLDAGDTIQYVTASGQTVTYVVSAIGDYLPEDNWNAIVASGTADLTIITCIGDFNRAIREYSHRRVVFARRV